MSCGDEKVRKCIPIVSTCCGNHMENVSMHGTKMNLYPVCVVAPSQLGIIPKTPYYVRDHAHYQRRFQAGISTGIYAEKLNHAVYMAIVVIC